MTRTHIGTLIARISQILLTLIILLCVVHFLQALVREVSTHSLFESSATGPSEYRQTHVKFLPDGTYHKVQETVTRKARGPHERYRKIYDANDRLLWEGLSSGDSPGRYLRWAQGGHLGSNGRWMASRYAVRAEFSSALEVLVKSSETSYLAWRYQRHQRIFAGYDMQGLATGFLGSNGFVTERSHCQPFDPHVGFQAWVPEGTTDRMMLWLTVHGLYQIHFSRQDIQVLFESPEAVVTQVRTLGWMSLSPETHGRVDPNQYRPLIDCETADGSHHLILRDPDEVFCFALPPIDTEEVTRRTQVTATHQAIFLAHAKATRPRPNEPWPTEWENMLYHLTPQGKLERIAHATSVSPSNVRMVHGVSAFEKGVRVVSPLVYRLLDPRWFFSDGILATERLHWFMTVTPIGIGPFFLSLVCMVIAVWHGWNRQSSRIGQGVWLVFVGLFNVAGLLTYLAMHHTSLVRCVACGKKRSLTQPSCVHCAAGLPRPQPEYTILIPA